jgi:hypothetical protein
MRHALLLLLPLFIIVNTAHAQSPGFIGLYSDDCYSDCFLADDSPVLFINVVHKATPGAKGAQFAVEPFGQLNVVWLADLMLHPLFNGNTQTGITVGYYGCPSSDILVAQILYYRFLPFGRDSGLRVIRDPRQPPLGGVQVWDCSLTERQTFGGTLVANPGRLTRCEYPDPVVHIDIRPGGCPNAFNIKWLGGGVQEKELYEPAEAPGRGVFPVAILGSVGFDVHDIDPTTITLGGVSPVASMTTYEDVSNHFGATEAPYCTYCPDDEPEEPDGYTDLVVKFRQRDVGWALAAIRRDYQPGHSEELRLEGSLWSGCKFYSWGCLTFVGAMGKAAATPERSADLSAPSPNPFNPVSRITYSLPRTGRVRLGIYDVSGRLIELLVDGVVEAGDHVAEWHASAQPSGVYFYRLETGGTVVSRRATLLK